MEDTSACDGFIYAADLIVLDFPASRNAAKEALGMEKDLARQENAMKRTNSSMQLTRAADYAVRVMIQLAVLPAGTRVSLPSLARDTGAPESFLSKVLQSLARAELIVSQRGQTGGFSITVCGRQASMREVIEAIDGEICLNVCLMHGKSCPRKARCPAHPVWARAQQAMLQVLSDATIAAMAGASPRHSASGAGTLYLPAKAVARS